MNIYFAFRLQCIHFLRSFALFQQRFDSSVQFEPIPCSQSAPRTNISLQNDNNEPAKGHNFSYISSYIDCAKDLLSFFSFLVFHFFHVSTNLSLKFGNNFRQCFITAIFEFSQDTGFEKDLTKMFQYIKETTNYSYRTKKMRLFYTKISLKVFAK